MAPWCVGAPSLPWQQPLWSATEQRCPVSQGEGTAGTDLNDTESGMGNSWSQDPQRPPRLWAQAGDGDHATYTHSRLRQVQQTHELVPLPLPVQAVCERYTCVISLCLPGPGFRKSAGLGWIICACPSGYNTYGGRKKKEEETTE